MTSEFRSVIERAILNYKSGKYGWCKAARFRNDEGWATSDVDLAKEADMPGSLLLAIRELQVDILYGDIYRKSFRLCLIMWGQNPVRINDGSNSMEEIIEYMTQIMENEHLLDILDVMQS